MTVSAQTTVNSSTGNGAATVYPYTFKILTAADLEVIVDGVTQTMTTHYTVSGAGTASGGDVTFLTAPASGAIVVRRRNMQYVRAADYQYQGDLPNTVLNPDLDAPVMMAQQLQEQVGRAIRGPAGESFDELPAASDRLDKFPSFNITTGELELSSITMTQVASAVSAAYAAGSTSDAVTFLPGATGSVATTVQAKLRNIIGVLDEGDTDNVGTLTLAVPGTYATIQAAMDYLNAHTIAAGTTVKIQVADGTYNLTANLNMNHPQGSQIQLVGNETTPASCILSVAGSGFDCLTVSDGNRLGYLNGFKFYKTAKALAADNTTAILANNGATIICGDDVIVDNWYYGIAARNGSTIECDYAQVDHSGDVGIWAFCGSFVQCRNAVSNNSIDVANDLGFGIQAEYGSTVDCQSASATGCRKAGIAALSNSHVRSLSSTTSTNTGSGLLARDGGTIEAHGATAINNTRYGIESIADGHVYYSSITASGNAINNFAPKAYFDNTQALGPRLVADDGDLRIDSSGAYNTYFNTSGGLQFAVIHRASAVNRLSVRGAVAGSGPTLEAIGDDAIIDIQILPKGAGSYVKLGAGYTATGDVVCNGYIPIKDDGGTVRKLMTTA